MDMNKQDLLRTLVNTGKTATVVIVAGTLLSLPLMLLEDVNGYRTYCMSMPVIVLAHIVCRSGTTGRSISQTGADVFNQMVGYVKRNCISKTK